MAKGKPGTRASLPPGAYSKPEVFSVEDLRLRVIGEDGVDLGEYRFDDLSGPPALLRSLVRGFARAAGPGGRWGSSKTLHANANRLRQFYRDVQRISPEIETIEDLTPVAWAAWRERISQRSRWPGTINSVRVILGLTPGLPEPVRVALRARNSKPKKRTVVTAYSKEEYLAIQRAAWKVVNGAAERIRAHVRELASYQQSIKDGSRLDSKSKRRGELLELLARTGHLPRNSRGHVEHSHRLALTADGDRSSASQVLFLTTYEVFAFMVLFVVLRGYNPESVATLTTEHQRPDGGVDITEVMSIDILKPRASRERQHASDNLVGLDPRSPAGLTRLAIELTEPARAVLRNLGEPTSRLLVCRLQGPNLPGHPFRLSINRTSASTYWYRNRLANDSEGQPIRVTLQRLRLTDQVVNRRPRMNSLETHETTYVLPEPSTARASEAAIIAGQTEALGHAQTTVRLRTISPAEYMKAKDAPALAAHDLGITSEHMNDLLAGRLDTAIAACVDFDHSPFSNGGSCTASFLMCLACENAVATPDHLRRLVCLKDALDKVASAVSPEVWLQDYSLHYQRLESLLNSSATSVEIERARSHIRPEERESVEALLTRRLDA